MVRYKVVFWQTDKGEKPVAQWLNALPVKDQEYLGNIFFDLAHDGPLSRPKAFKHLEGQLWEIKDKRSLVPGYRIYFGFDGNIICLVVNAGNKSTQDRDIKLAQKRLESVSWKK